MTEQDRRAAMALYDRFTHEGMDRRAFMAQLTRIAGGAAAAATLLGGIAARAEAAPRIAADDRRLRSRTEVMRLGPSVRLSAYRTALADMPGRQVRRKPRPVVVVIHENRGLNEHVRDVARRAALAGYHAVAPDFLSLDGGRTPDDEDQARAAIGALDMARTLEAGRLLIGHLNEGERPEPSGGRVPVGIVGFCWGGAMVHRLALAAGDSLAAGVSFYGPAPDPAEAARLRAPLLVLLAGRDQRVNRTAMPYIAAAQAAGKPVGATTYPDVDHAFHNDTSAERYNAAAAEHAWAATLSFFGEHLR